MALESNRDSDGAKRSYPESLAGYFLISELEMADPNFYRTVVLMITHNHNGAFGLVVNRRSEATLADILPEYDSPRGKETPVYVGGPVQQEYLFMVHSDLPAGAPSPQSISPAPGIIFEPSFEHAKLLFDEEKWQSIPPDDRPRIHLYLGYSGWSPGQLEWELEQGAWMIHPARPKIVFHPRPDEGWKDALREKGGLYKVFADTDQNPSLN